MVVVVVGFEVVVVGFAVVVVVDVVVVIDDSDFVLVLTCCLEFNISLSSSRQDAVSEGPPGPEVVDGAELVAGFWVVDAGVVGGRGWGGEGCGGGGCGCIGAGGIAGSTTGATGAIGAIGAACGFRVGAQVVVVAFNFSHGSQGFNVVDGAFVVVDDGDDGDVGDVDGAFDGVGCPSTVVRGFVLLVVDGDAVVVGFCEPVVGFPVVEVVVVVVVVGLWVVVVVVGLGVVVEVVVVGLDVVVVVGLDVVVVGLDVVVVVVGLADVVVGLDVVVVGLDVVVVVCVGFDVDVVVDDETFDRALPPLFSVLGSGNSVGDLVVVVDLDDLVTPDLDFSSSNLDLSSSSSCFDLDFE